MLFSGCCAVRVDPAVWVWKCNTQRAGIFCLKRSRIIGAHSRRAARNLAISSAKLLCELKKNERRGAKSSGFSPARIAAST